VGSERIAVRADPDGVRIEIPPPVSSPPLARRLAAAGSLLAAGTLFAAVRLSGEWHQVAAGRETIPTGALAALSAAVLLGSPAALFGLIALFFAEETLEVRRDAIVREISIFGRGERKSFPRSAQTRLLWTTRPVAPWWTWTFRRLALVTGKRRLGVGATLGNEEKTALAALLARLIE